MEQQEGIQVNKYISSSGFCSRREADTLIMQERVTINGRTVGPTARVHEKDKVAVDGELIRNNRKEPLYLAFNKPLGITSTTDERDKTNIISFINHNRRIFPVGRLDKDSEGLILLTDDGDIVNKILRAENAHEKEYVVVVDKAITTEFTERMAKGVHILDTVTKPCKVRAEGNRKFRIILTQGLNRQIRRMCEALGYKVKSLRRTRIMHIKLGDLPAGKYRKLLPAEVEALMAQTSHSASEQGVFVHKPRKAKTYARRPAEHKGGETGARNSKPSGAKRTKPGSGPKPGPGRKNKR